MAQAQWRIPCAARCVDLAARQDPVRHARGVVRRYLTSADPAPGGETAAAELIDAALLIADELVTNACRHTSGPLTLLLLWERESLAIEVDDPSPLPPVPVPEERRGESGGFGLQIVASLADEWSVHRHPGGKTVRARMSFPSRHGSVPWQGPAEGHRLPGGTGKPAGCPPAVGEMPPEANTRQGHDSDGASLVPTARGSPRGDLPGPERRETSADGQSSAAGSTRATRQPPVDPAEGTGCGAPLGCDAGPATAVGPPSVHSDRL
ncbi:ATP-binding protein [Streptomyces sp. NPDC048639]|uniref:ATP-binding protein n=1 Tax=Streptomyces sp. NPDC048639 TaxID=3365581 RepID=UPI003713DEBC